MDMPKPKRRLVLLKGLALAAGGGLLLPAARAQGPALRTLAVVPLDFIEHHPNPDPAVVAAQQRRLPRAHEQLQREIAQRQLYRVLDFAPALPLLASLRNQQEYIHTCVDCAVQLGRKLGAELVMTSWVQKLTELVLNFNVELIDVASEKVRLTKSVDMRSNNDESWERSVRYLVRDMAEKRQADPRYGS